jgi:hypothetical protein
MASGGRTTNVAAIHNGHFIHACAWAEPQRNRSQIIQCPGYLEIQKPQTLPLRRPTLLHYVITSLKFHHEMNLRYQQDEPLSWWVSQRQSLVTITYCHYQHIGRYHVTSNAYRITPSTSFLTFLLPKRSSKNETRGHWCSGLPDRNSSATDSLSWNTNGMTKSSTVKCWWSSSIVAHWHACEEQQHVWVGHTTLQRQDNAQMPKLSHAHIWPWKGNRQLLSIRMPSSGMLYCVARVRRLLVTDNVVPSSPILVTLVMEGQWSSETSVMTRTMCRKIPEDSILHSQCRENLKSYIALTGWTL